MPVAKFYASGYTLETDAVQTFLDQASDLYAEILECPKDRVRVYFFSVDADFAAVEGRVPGDASFFFEFIVLEGRPLTQRQDIARGFCELAVTALGIEARRVRGQCNRVQPEDWCIGGQFASDLRKAEIDARKNQLKR